MFDLKAYAELLGDHIEEAHKMANVIEAAGFPARADRMRNCCTYTKGVYCPTCHTFHTTAGSLCRDRLCPNCGWNLSRKRAVAVAEAVDMVSRHMDIVPLHFMLTVQHDEKSDLSDRINCLIQGFHSLIGRQCIKKHLLGYVRNVEITKGDAGFHPHLHVLMVFDGDYYKDKITQPQLAETWQKCLRVDYTPIVWIKAAYATKEGKDTLQAAVYECVKYTIKSSDWLRLGPDELKTLMQAVYSRRFFSVGGALYLPYRCALKEAQEAIADDPATRCSKCGSKRRVAVFNSKGGAVDVKLR